MAKVKHKHKWMGKVEGKTGHISEIIQCFFCKKYSIRNKLKSFRNQFKGCFGKPKQHPIYVNPKKRRNER